MDVLGRVRKVFAEERNDVQLDKFLSDVRDSLAGSNRQFLSYFALAVGSIVAYHLVVYGGSKSLSINGINLSDSELFRKVFLVVPAAVLAAQSGVGYLRRLQRETYDYLSISRYQILGETGLHELRLPGDYLLGYFILGIEGGVFGKIISRLSILLFSTIAHALPLAYIVIQSVTNLQKYGPNDAVSVAASGLALLLCAIAVVVGVLAGRIKAT